MIYLEYVLIAFGVTFLSIKASDYVDWLDKKTKLSGAFIGGVMLSAVTSLPELFSSISATTMLKEPELCIGNILGSDLFNISMLCFVILFFAKDFSKSKTSKNHLIVSICVAICFVAIILNWKNVFNVQWLSFNLTSIVLIACYAASIKFLSGEGGEQSQNSNQIPLSLKQIIIRFILVSVGIIGLSIFLSYVTDDISEKLNLGKGIAGALFMGVATSLPEMASTISLFKKKNYDIAVGNIVGSNVFNLFILGFVDVISSGNIYDFSDPKTINLLIYGLIGTLLIFGVLKLKKQWCKILSSVLVVLCYVAFLVL